MYKNAGIKGDMQRKITKSIQLLCAIYTKKQLKRLKNCKYYANLPIIWYYDYNIRHANEE